jgi:hypothetical protein
MNTDLHVILTDVSTPMEKQDPDEDCHRLEWKYSGQ